MILPYSASSSPLTWYLCLLQQGPSSNPPSASPWLLTVDSWSAALTFMIHILYLDRYKTAAHLRGPHTKRRQARKMM